MRKNKYHEEIMQMDTKELLRIIQRELDFWTKAKTYLTLLENPNRAEIMDLVRKKRMSITDISNKIKLSYKNTFFHIKALENAGLVTTTKEQKTQGRKVYVEHSGKTMTELLLAHINNKEPNLT